MNDLRNPQTKCDAVAFVSAVIRNGNAILSDDFVTAMDISRKFDVSAEDVLEYRRARVTPREL